MAKAQTTKTKVAEAARVAAEIAQIDALTKALGQYRYGLAKFGFDCMGESHPSWPDICEAAFKLFGVDELYDMARDAECEHDDAFLAQRRADLAADHAVDMAREGAA